MDEASIDVRNLSGTTSRLEQIEYLVNGIGLDPTSANLFYWGERLQEKGQLKQCIKYYEAVLKKYPDCSDVQENLSIVKEMIVEDTTGETKPLPMVSEETQSLSSQFTVTQMEVKWKDFELHRNVVKYIGEPDDCALWEAQRKLREVGYGSSQLKMLSNSITKVYNTEIEWEKHFEGKALFQVTLIPEEDWSSGVLDASTLESLIERPSVFPSPKVNDNLDPPNPKRKRGEVNVPDYIEYNNHGNVAALPSSSCQTDPTPLHQTTTLSIDSQFMDDD